MPRNALVHDIAGVWLRQRVQSHQSVEVVVRWRRLLPLNIHMLYDDSVTWRI